MLERFEIMMETQAIDFVTFDFKGTRLGSKNPLVRLYLRVPQAAGQVVFWMIPNVN